MKLHWSPRSPYVRKVMLAAHELGLADQIETVRTVVAMSAVNPAIQLDNPLGKIPTLVLADGTALFDSLTIIEHLDSLAGPVLCPPSGPQRWRMLTLHALGHGLLDVLILWRNERDKPAERQTPELLHAYAAKVAATLDRLEATVPTWAEMRFGIGHIAVGCALSYTDFRFAAVAWRDGRAALADWYGGFAARPSARATALIDG